MERYEVLVSPKWPNLATKSDFPIKNYINENENIWETSAVITTIISVILWAIIGGVLFFEILPKNFHSNLLEVIYLAGFIWFPAIMYNAINLWFRYFKAGGRANEALKNANRQREERAKQLSNELNGIVDRSQVIVKKLPEYLSDAYRCLRIAEQEYNESAFSPFWDQIEKATRSLSEFYNDIKQLCQNGKEYTSKLYGKLHNFPVFIYDLEAEKIYPVPVVSELNRIVRKGQTNFQFATIFEQKKTQKILIMGFRNLGDAISNLSYSMESSISELTGSISNDIQRVSRSVSEDIGRLSDQSEDHFRRQSKISDEQFKRQSRLLTEQLYHAEQTKDNLEKIARKLKAY